MKRLEVVVLFLLVVAVVVPVGVSAQMSNWVWNGGFEQGDFQWLFNGGQVVSDVSFRGRQSVLLPPNIIWTQHIYGHFAHDVMTAGAYVNVPAGCDPTIMGWLQPYDPPPGCSFTVFYLEPVVGDWTWVSADMDFSSCDGVDHWNFSIGVGNASECSIHFDNIYLGPRVQVVEVPQPVTLGGFEVHQDFFSQSSPR